MRRIDRCLLEAAYDNDPSVARRYARDLTLLRRAGVAVATGDEWAVVDSPPPPPCLPDELVVELPEPLLVRLDAVAAGVLGLSRSAVRGRLAVGDRSARLDGLRLWTSVTIGQRRQ